jgi:spore maturation protein SpmB
MNENNTATMFRFLNQLRASGSMNMFGASPVLAEAFGISSKEARVVLAHWMSWASQNPHNFSE